MDSALSREVLQALLRLRHVGAYFAQTLGGNLGAYVLMEKIAGGAFEGGGEDCVSGMREELFISKAAISQMLDQLERRGYMRRKVDRSNRRKLALTLTPQGLEALGEARAKMEALLAKIIARLGAAETEQLMALFGRFTDVLEALRSEKPPAREEA